MSGSAQTEFLARVKWAEFISGSGRTAGESSVFRAGPARARWLAVLFSTVVAITCPSASGVWIFAAGPDLPDVSSASSEHLTGIKPVYGHQLHIYYWASTDLFGLNFSQTGRII